MDIQRHINDEAVLARPPSAAYRIQKLVRRNKLSFAAAAAVACALVLGLVVSAWQAVRATNAEQAEKAQAEQARADGDRAVLAERKTREQLQAALLEQARATVRSGELGQRVRTLDAVRRAAAMSNTVELRREAFAALALPDLRFELELPLAADVTLAVLDPKFERLAVGSGNAVEIRSVPDQRLLATFPASASERATFGKWSPDGRFLAIRRGRAHPATRKPTHVEVWDVASGRQVLSLPRTRGARSHFIPACLGFLVVTWAIPFPCGIWRLAETSRATAHFAVTGMHPSPEPSCIRSLACLGTSRPSRSVHRITRSPGRSNASPMRPIRRVKRGFGPAFITEIRATLAKPSAGA
jgi:hypothetical protein